jgi:uncharacterized protein (DUF2235 family)
MDDDKTLYQMPPFTGRNILIFSDGTGQASGLLFDESRSNVYKLFRATRCGPDSSIDPSRQLAFYDAGLGSKLNGNRIKIGWFRRIYNVVSSATGLGISRNIMDCYSALIMLWRPGDRIFLFGFSRGAYTVRCLGGVLGLCGIPTRAASKQLPLRNPATIEKIAAEAVMRVYRHGSGAGEDQNTSPEKQKRMRERKDRLLGQRKALGAQFGEKYASAGPSSNAIPHFIGVWDTVAAVGISPPAWRMVTSIAAIIAVLISMGTAWRVYPELSFSAVLMFFGALILISTAGWIVSLLLRVKFATGLPGYPWYKTMHLTPIKITFFDRSLNENVRYARHALAIDERRADFDRVAWENDGEPPKRELAEGPWFTQYWFAGNHSDVGGSYPENESRLSDISLKWMATQAMKAGLIVDDRYLNLTGRPDGPQHDECKAGISLLGFKFKWREQTRQMVDNATVHGSVMERFKGGPVLIYDEEKPYRPEILTKHVQFADLFSADASTKEIKLNNPISTKG